MNAEILAIGSELLLGQIIDTNSAFIARRLAENGIPLVHTMTVGDDLDRMEAAIRSAIERSPILITTGGIGPTEDDLTREAISRVAGRPLTFQPHLMAQIEAIFKGRGFRMAENNRKQAYIPEGAIAIENPKGTAPGFIVESPDWVTISIPGVPLEMEYLMDHAVIPYLRRRFSLDRQVIRYRVLRACGVGESAIGLQIKDLMKQGQNPSVGTLASTGDIRIRITAEAKDLEEASDLIRRMEDEIRKRLGILVYGVDDETLHGNIVKDLERFGFTLAVAETLTGGTISEKLAITGSRLFVQGLILHSELSQQHFLNLSTGEFNSLRQDPIRVTDLFAEKVRKDYGMDLGLATFGRTLGGGEGKEYRIEIFCSLSTSSGSENQSHVVGGEPAIARERASILTLDMLRKHLLKKRHNA